MGVSEYCLLWSLFSCREINMLKGLLLANKMNSGSDSSDLFLYCSVVLLIYILCITESLLAWQTERKKTGLLA